VIGRAVRRTTVSEQPWSRRLISSAGFYVGLGIAASVALIVFLIVGYGMFRHRSVDIGKSGPASEWAGALFTALSILVLAYQLRMIGLAAERREARNLDLIQPSHRLSAWTRNASEPGWLLTVAVRNESEGQLIDPVVGLGWRERPLDQSWLIGAPDEQQTGRNRTNARGELRVEVGSVKISPVDLPILLVHIPLRSCAEMDEVGARLKVSLEWGPTENRSRREDVPMMSARAVQRSTRQ
jgi:hypothetical protein